MAQVGTTGVPTLGERDQKERHRPAAAQRPGGGPWRHLPAYLAISPFYVLFVVFGVFPIAFSLYLSFHDWDGIGDMRFVGWQQYNWLIHDSVFWKSVLNTVEIWVIATVPMLFLALIIAFLLNSQIRHSMAYQVAYFTPNVTSMVAMTIVFGSVFAQTGLGNSLLKAIGVGEFGWLASPWGIKLSIALMIMWRWVGYNALIFLAGLQAIPVEVYEAARVDGASSWQILFRVVVPLLRPVILFAVVISSIYGMQIFTESQVLFPTGTGGPGQEGLTIVVYLWDKAFDNHQLGYGAAIGWALFVIVAIFAIINWRLVSAFGADHPATSRRWSVLRGH